MSSFVPPVVRHMLLCEDVTPYSGAPERMTVEGIWYQLDVPLDASFPVVLPRLCVYLALTGGRGAADMHVRAVFADSGQQAFATRLRRISFTSDPLHVETIILRLTNCPFRAAGLYLIQFLCDGKLVASQPFLVRVDQ